MPFWSALRTLAHGATNTLVTLEGVLENPQNGGSARRGAQQLIATTSVAAGALRVS